MISGQYHVSTGTFCDRYPIYKASAIAEWLAAVCGRRKDSRATTDARARANSLHGCLRMPITTKLCSGGLDHLPFSRANSELSRIAAVAFKFATDKMASGEISADPAVHAASNRLSEVMRLGSEGI
jgi:phage terminase small subunit